MYSYMRKALKLKNEKTLPWRQSNLHLFVLTKIWQTHTSVNLYGKVFKSSNFIPYYLYKAHGGEETCIKKKK